MAMDNKLNKQNKLLGRYTGIIISIVLFLILITSILVTSIYNSLKIAELRLQTVTSTFMRDYSHEITKELLDLKVNYAENPDSPNIPKLIDNLTNLEKRFDENLKAFESGGEIIGPSGKREYMDPANNQVRMSYALDTKKLWEPLGVKINEFLQNANDPVARQFPLNEATNISREIDQAMYDNMNKLSGDMVLENAGRAKFLRTVQSFGISFAILYFIVFMAFFVRKLRQSDRATEDAKRETTNILDTVSSGLFLLDKDLNIGQQHSKALVNIIAKSDIGGKNLRQVLDDMIPSDDMAITEGFVEQLYNPRVKERLVDDLNPLKKVAVFLQKNGENVKRYLDFDFARVYEGKEIKQILVNVNDITNSVQLEQKLEYERKQNDQQIQMIATVLNSDMRIVREFVRNAKKHCERINVILKSPEADRVSLLEKLDAIFREIHSLKGEASAIDVKVISNKASVFEAEIKDAQSLKELTGNDFLPLIVHLDDLIELISTIDQLSLNLKSASNVTLTASPETGNAQQESVTSSQNQIHEYYTKFVNQIAERNGKQAVIQLSVAEAVFNQASPLHDAAKEIAIQLLRNAVVHGVEAPQTRMAKNKPSQGTINLSVQENQDILQVTVKDDGGGINYDAIRQKALTMKGLTRDMVASFEKRQLLALLFSPGFSTANSTSEDAGQGVGLDIINSRAKQFNGKIRVDSELDKFTTFTVTFKK